MIATTAVTVTVGKKTAIAGGKEATFVFAYTSPVCSTLLSLSEPHFSLARRHLSVLKPLVSLLSSRRQSVISAHKTGFGLFDWICWWHFKLLTVKVTAGSSCAALSVRSAAGLAPRMRQRKR